MIEESIRDRGLAFTALTDLIGRNMHITQNHNSDNNYVVVNVINDETPIEVQLESNQSEAAIQFDCYSKSAQSAKDIAKTIDTIFNKQGFADARVNVQFAKKESRLPDYEPDSGLFRESSDYIFYYHITEV